MTASRLEILDNVFFKSNADVIEKRSYPLLDNVAQVIKSHPDVTRIRVEGHTDNQGGLKKNLDLSDRRARSVMRYLVDQGVEPSRLEARGFGPTQPIATNYTADGRAKNRRVVFALVGAGAAGPSEDTMEKQSSPKAPGKKK